MPLMKQTMLYHQLYIACMMVYEHSCGRVPSAKEICRSEANALAQELSALAHFQFMDTVKE